MLFRPSGSNRWMSCALSVRQPPDRPDDDSDAARQGTCAARVAEVVINGDASAADDLLGRCHENGWEVDEEMVRHVQWYIDIVSKHPGSQAEVFMKHDIGLQGTADTACYDKVRDFLWLWDLKYGYLPIGARGNWQLLCYLWLWCAVHNHYPQMAQLAICQPRPLHRDGPYRKWVVSQAEYMPYLHRISQRITDIINGETTAVPGPYCSDCALAIGCDALTQTVYQLMDTVMQSRVYRSPDPQQLSDELTMLDGFNTLFKARYTAVQAEAEARLSEGGFVPGYVLEKRWGKKKFTVSDGAIQMITGIDPVEKKTCTPAELIRRGAKEDVVKTITAIPFIGTKLEKMDADDVTAKFNSAQKGVANG